MGSFAREEAYMGISNPRTNYKPELGRTSDKTVTLMTVPRLASYSWCS